MTKSEWEALVKVAKIMRKSFKREKLQQQQQQPHPALDFSIPKKKRGSGDKFIMIKKARQQQQSLLLGKKTTMVMTITHQGSTWVFNKSHNDDHMLSREQVLKRERLPMVLQEQEEENNVKQTRKKIKGSDGLARRSEFEEELSDGAEEWVQVTSPKRLSGAPTGNNKKLKKKKNKSGSSGVRACNSEIPNPSRELPDEFKRRISEMGGTNITLVITKRLTDTDCREQEQRLSMLFTKIMAPEFLEGSEKDHLQGRDESGKKNGKSVWLIQPNHEDIEINLRRWDMAKKESPGGGSSMYVLVKPWNDVVRENGLKSGDAIQVWSFRVGAGLAYLLIRWEIQQYDLFTAQKKEEESSRIYI